MVTIDKIFHASVVLKDIIRPTPLAKAYGIAEDCALYLKPECLQKTGSFKLRGSGYKIAMLSDEEKAKGVIACSAGNHAQGVALAASKMRHLLPSSACPMAPPSPRWRPPRATAPRSAWYPASTTMPTTRLWN